MKSHVSLEGKKVISDFFFFLKEHLSYFARDCNSKFTRLMFRRLQWDELFLFFFLPDQISSLSIDLSD